MPYNPEVEEFKKSLLMTLGSDGYSYPKTFSPEVREFNAGVLSKLGELGNLWWDRLVGDPVNAMGRIGGAMLGQNTYPVDEINDPRMVRMAQAQDVLNALGAYAGPGILAGKPRATVASTFGGQMARKPPGDKAAWFTGMEGKPKFEIDDSAMNISQSLAKPLGDNPVMSDISNKFFESNNRVMTLSDLIQHDTLSINIQNYPMSLFLLEHLKKEQEGNLMETRLP